MNFESKKVRRPGNSADRVYEVLRRAVIEQAIAPGSPLPEGEVAERFGVSRTVVRAALTRLIENGLAVRPANHGTRVASPTLDEAFDIMAIRRSVEAIVTGRLAGQLTKPHMRRLRAHVAREAEAQGGDGTESIRLSGEFHILLAEATGSPLLLRYVSELVSRSSLALAANGRPHSGTCGTEEHRSLLDCIEGDDGTAACACMDDHLRQVTERALLVPPQATRFADLPAHLLEPPAGRPRPIDETF